MLCSAGTPASIASSPSSTPSPPSPPSSSSPPEKRQKIAAFLPNSSPEKVAMMRTPQPPDSILAVLSVDLLIQILDRLPDSGDRKSCRLVSRGFLRAEALHRRALRILRRESLPSLLCRYSALESLVLSPCPALDDAALAAAIHIAGGLRTLKTVCLARASGIGWRGLQVLVAACPRLEAVDLSHCVGVGDREVAALAAAGGLREVRLDKCLGITDVGLAKLAVGCLGIETLGIKWCMKISDLGIDLLSKKCRDLKVLDISYLKVVSQIPFTKLRSFPSGYRGKKITFLAFS